jgi:hypothetical protein
MVWREVENFSSSGVCLVMAFTGFDKADHHDDYDRFAVAMVRRRDPKQVGTQARWRRSCPGMGCHRRRVRTTIGLGDR